MSSVYPRGRICVAAECKNLSIENDYIGFANDIEKLGRFVPRLNPNSNPQANAIVHMLLALTFYDEAKESWVHKEPRGKLSDKPAARRFFRKMKKGEFIPLKPVLVGHRKPETPEFSGRPSASPATPTRRRRCCMTIIVRTWRARPLGSSPPRSSSLSARPTLGLSDQST